MPVIVSKATQSLVLPAALRSIFPDAPLLDPMHIVVPHGMREMLLLQHAGYKIPNPIMEYYDFPHPEGEPPFKVQTITVKMLTENPRGYVLNDMGTGKSRAALWAWDALNKKGLAG